MGETITITTKHIDGLRFISKGSVTGVSIVMDSGKRPEGGSSATPMELFLMAFTGCSGIDVALILNRMRIPYENLVIEAKGERASDNPKKYIKIHLIYRVKGEAVDEEKVKRAVELSKEKYCSIWASLHPDIDVTYAIEIIKE